MELRRATKEELRAAVGPPAEFDADAIQANVRDRDVLLSRAAFKKKPDTPLKEVIDLKLQWRGKRSKARKSN